MTPIPTAAAAALAFLILLISCLALGLGVGTPQVHGPLFWAVSAGFAMQAVAAAVWLVRLIAVSLIDATSGGTGRRAAD
ncbi:hypothetical protein ACFOD9_09610 [Novosphingobium bradum]|uniref:Uncharacterized protein n=1 Tax=Novosphingobium bradum TaxID=1737444 RepID=A0ABV7ISF1_9SPHN